MAFDQGVLCVRDGHSLNAIMNEYGVAIVPSVLSKEECDAFNRGMWTMLETFGVGIEEKDPTTWKKFYELWPMHSMLMQYFGVGHWQEVWNLRQNPKIAAIFADFWGVLANELIVSFDGVSIHLPHETTGRGYYKGNDWQHADQAFTAGRHSFECMQGWVTGNDVRKGDATLRVR